MCGSTVVPPRAMKRSRNEETSPEKGVDGSKSRRGGMQRRFRSKTRKDGKGRKHNWVMSDLVSNMVQERF